VASKFSWLTPVGQATVAKAVQCRTAQPPATGTAVKNRTRVTSGSAVLWVGPRHSFHGRACAQDIRHERATTIKHKTVIDPIGGVKKRSDRTLFRNAHADQITDWNASFSNVQPACLAVGRRPSRGPI
jgi:hypothetical protein